MSAGGLNPYPTIVPLKDWLPATDDAIYEGVLDKDTLIDPTGVVSGTWFIKQAKDRRGAMVWSEWLTSKIGNDVLGFDTQQAKLGQRDGKLVMMVKFFRDPQFEFLDHGAEYLMGQDPEYDYEKQTRHRWSLVFSLLDMLEKRGLCRDPHIPWWGQTFAFDTLLCNGDRHGNNWGFIFDRRQVACPLRYAPRFDHNNVLAFGWDDTGIENAVEKHGSLRTAAAHFVRRGGHHMRWDEPSKKKLPRQEFNELFLAAFPETRDTFAAVAELDLRPIERLLTNLVILPDVPTDYDFSELRAHFCLEILTQAQSALKATLVKL